MQELKGYDKFLNKEAREWAGKINYIAKYIREWGMSPMAEDRSLVKYDLIIFLNDIYYSVGNWAWDQGFLAINGDGRILFLHEHGEGFDSPSWDYETNIPKKFSRLRTIKIDYMKGVIEKIIDPSRDMFELINKVYKICKDNENRPRYGLVPS